MTELIKNIKEITNYLQDINKKNRTIQILSTEGNSSYYRKLMNYNSIFDKSSEYQKNSLTYIPKQKETFMKIADNLFDIETGYNLTLIDKTVYPDYACTKDNSNSFNKKIYDEKIKFQSWNLNFGFMSKNRFMEKHFFNLENVLKRISVLREDVIKRIPQLKTNYIQSINKEIQSKIRWTHTIQEIKQDEDFNSQLEKTKSDLTNLFTQDIILNKIILSIIIVCLNKTRATKLDTIRGIYAGPIGEISTTQITYRLLAYKMNNNKEFTLYEPLIKTIETLVSSNRTVFKERPTITTYANLYQISRYKKEEEININFKSLFEEQRLTKIQQNQLDMETNKKIIYEFNSNSQYQSQMNSFDLILNLCFLYSKKSEFIKIIKSIADKPEITDELIGGDITFRNSNLLLKKDSIIKYINNLEQLSELNETIKKNKKIIENSQNYVKYVKYYLKIIEYLDELNKDRRFVIDEFINLVAINYSKIKSINENVANKIFSGINKKDDNYLLLINSNQECLNLISLIT